MAFLIIDMQRAEALWNGLDNSRWSSLSKTLFDLSGKLTKFDVPTIHITHQQYIPNFPPMVGQLHEINQFLEDNYHTSLRRGPYQFRPPVNNQAIVATKETYSAETKPILEYLNSRAVDTIIIGGVWERDLSETRACVTATALDFAKNYRTIIVDGGTNVPMGSNPPWHVQFSRLGIEVLSSADIVKLAQSKHQTLLPPRETTGHGSHGHLTFGVPAVT